MPTDIVINGDFRTNEGWDFAPDYTWVIDTAAGTMTGYKQVEQFPVLPVLDGKTYSWKIVVDELQGGGTLWLKFGWHSYSITSVGTHEFNLDPYTDWNYFHFTYGSDPLYKATLSFVSCTGYFPYDLSISPACGPENGGTEVTILGTDFDWVDNVKFDGIAATDFVLVSPIKITCTTPAHSFGKVDVTLLSGATTIATIPEGFFYGIQPHFVVMVKRDSVTGKIMKVGSKIQTIPRPPCSSCEQFQPEELTVSLSGFADCTGCINCAAKGPSWWKWISVGPPGGSQQIGWWVPYKSFKVEGLAASINDKEFTVKHLRGCIYQSTFVGEYGTLTFYKKEDCDEEGGVAVYSITRLTISIADVGVNTETGERRIQIVIGIWGAAPDTYSSNCSLNIFSGHITYNDFENAAAWQDAHAYSIDDMVFHGEWAYKCTKAHTSSVDNEPGVGSAWKDYWKYGRETCFEVEDVAYNDFTSCCDGVEGATEWTGGHSYSIGDIVSKPAEENSFFKCIQDHTSSEDNEPGAGKYQWDYWRWTHPYVRPCGATGEVDILYEG